MRRAVHLNTHSFPRCSTFCDDFLVLHVPGEYDQLFETVFKTELVVLLQEKAREAGGDIAINFSDTYVKWQSLPR